MTLCEKPTCYLGISELQFEAATVEESFFPKSCRKTASPKSGLQPRSDVLQTVVIAAQETPIELSDRRRCDHFAGCQCVTGMTVLQGKSDDPLRFRDTVSETIWHVCSNVCVLKTCQCSADVLPFTLRREHAVAQLPQPDDCSILVQ